MAKRGVTLLDLIAPSAGSQAVLPDDLASRLENLAVTEHRSTTSATTIVYEGVIQPIADFGFPALRSWPVEVPGLNGGLPFRLVRTRRTPGSGENLEPAAASVVERNKCLYGHLPVCKDDWYVMYGRRSGCSLISGLVMQAEACGP